MPVRLSVDQRAKLASLIASDAPSWIGHNFYISDPRDPITGDELNPGLIRLVDHQAKILRLATTKKNGLFKWATIIYSAVKKSGKTRVAAAVTSWYASTHGNYNEVYLVANDGKQSNDRLLSAIKQSIRLCKRLAPDKPMASWRITKPRIELPGGTFIEAIPCDPTGQAGANPGMTAWSELWGYRHEHKARLWSEMTIPPTRWGKALRWVESYAGFSGESHVLEGLYNLGVHGGVPHPAIPKFPVYINRRARTFCYWDEIPRMPWQTPEYYAQEAELLTPDEFRRIHKNQWVNPVEKAIQIEWWDECDSLIIDGEELPPLDDRTPVILAIDASVSHDSSAAVLVSRHPVRRTEPSIRQVRIWEPPKGAKLDLRETVYKYVKEARNKYNVLEMAYDEYQMALMATDVRRELGIHTHEFGQNRNRSIADSNLYTRIIQREITHNGDLGLRAHVDNAAVKKVGSSGIRFIKMDGSTKRTGQTAKPIDALIASSMGSDRCVYLNMG